MDVERPPTQFELIISAERLVQNLVCVTSCDLAPATSRRRHDVRFYISNKPVRQQHGADAESIRAD